MQSTTLPAAGIPLVPPIVQPPLPAVAPLPLSEAGKPEIPEVQANWHVHKAGLDAEAAARAGGTDPQAAAALMDAVVGGPTIAGARLPPINGAFILILPLIQQVCGKSDPLNNESGQMMVMAYALVHPEITWRSLRDPSQLSSFEDAVWQFASRLNVDDLRTAYQWINSEVERMRSDAEDKEVGKP